MDTLDYQSAFLAGLKIKIIFPDGTVEYAENESDIANLDGLATFAIAED